MSSPVKLTLIDQLALIRVYSPPVNALGHAVRAGLLQALREAEANPGVRMLLLHCSGRTFIAGADIREFGQPSQAPTLPELTQAIEACSKPVLAALHGSVLGGGLEVAMACHYRIAHQTTRLGMPEVKLGLVPGAGGTQRLPRLVGVARALEMIVGGEPIDALQALDAGLVDALFDDEEEPVTAGLGHAMRLLAADAGPRRSGERGVAPVDAGLFQQRRLREGRERPDAYAPLRCIAAVEAATCLPLAEGLQRERALFLDCMQSPERAALVTTFFAQRQAAKASRNAG
ncbi:enoyl-CoA hydratase/isomerase family protein [Pseudomonas sp. S31]|uniref:enoyl-CoA hydratase-related protein n=1 Tax=Pseudomonas sp. S31 TaxID=1564473 RepID=UPI0019142C10|nr:enoyl-CoA hydratase-related protein [Pseudomonas sp. S31]MBK5000942.1 enoyl-CoA hydratase/isomerase family protein [Pseudomonas sp. S31]